MSRIYDYHERTYYGGDSRSSMDEYLERLDRLQRTPTVTDDYLNVPNEHKFHHTNSAHPEKHDDHHIKIFHVNHHQPAPEMQKKVHFSEHQKTVEVDRKGKHEVYEEKTIDVEADGYLQKRHRNFESYNTMKPY